MSHRFFPDRINFSVMAGLAYISHCLPMFWDPNVKNVHVLNSKDPRASDFDGILIASVISPRVGCHGVIISLVLIIN
jgi:hypothetical protein